MWYFAQFGDGTRNGHCCAGKYQKSPQVICGKSKKENLLTAGFLFCNKILFSVYCLNLYSIFDIIKSIKIFGDGHVKDFY